MKILTGMIVIWHGTSGTVPAGYYICDGNNGTPDLRDRVPLCGDFIQPAGYVAGNWQHSHAFTNYSHYHRFLSGSGFAAGMSFSTDTDAVNVSGNTMASQTLTPGVGMHYLMKA